MQLLILFIGENEQFDQNKLIDIVKNIPGIENIALCAGNRQQATGNRQQGE
ncbi:MAG: hypothetical protein F6K54_14375 [Okeania sp. SIO3B5]|uniref:hypothetical protein n=1 Tax=Okeania sp. SIO3B5 TaxID=2607811 RepID=UPI00140141E6|nr:hypothetical protein [Okeania sp. SIO3B5]NEO54160.1 hypothetical protein [Okeania sp. SIO3B5]